MAFPANNSQQLSTNGRSSVCSKIFVSSIAKFAGIILRRRQKLSGVRANTKHQYQKINILGRGSREVVPPASILHKKRGSVNAFVHPVYITDKYLNKLVHNLFLRQLLLYKTNILWLHLQKSTVSLVIACIIAL